MSQDRRLRARMRALCAELGPDDGVASHELEKTERDPARDHRHDRLAGQISRAVSMALASSRDPDLQPLWVVRAEPFPDAGRFQLWIGSDLPMDPTILERLHAVRGWLRSEVASAIRRRRVPDLVFAYAPDGEQP